MSIFKRISAIIRSEKPVSLVKINNPFEDSQVGDIIHVNLEEYVITGKVIYFDRGFPPHRYAYYIQNGREISCLLVEKGRAYECFFCQFVEGSLDDPNDVPVKLEVDEFTYELEHHRSDLTRTEGNSDFRSGDEVLFWRYFSKQDPFFFLQWQDGKFVAMEGNKLPGGEVQFLNSTSRRNL